jgi:Flp pilus assembly protein TadD
MLGTLLRTGGRGDEAIAEFKDAIRLRPDSIEAHQSLAQVLQQKGDGSGAKAARHEADRLTRRKADAQASAFAVSVGRQKLKSGDRPAAIAQFREAIRLAPENADAHHALAQTLQQNGADAEARLHFEQAHKLAPHLYPREERQ